MRERKRSRRIRHRSGGFPTGIPDSIIQTLPAKAVAQDHLYQQVIGTCRDAYAHTEIKLPFRAQIQVDSRQDLLLLLAQRIEASHRTERAIILQTAGDLRRDVVTDFEVRRKFQPTARVGTVEGAVQRWVERAVPASQLFIDDGADLPGPGIRREDGALIADLRRQADSYRQVIALRYGHARADVRAHPHPASAGLVVGKLIQPRLEPIVPAV